MSTTTTTMGGRIRARRTKLKLKQRALAQLIGRDPVSMWRYEQDSMTPAAETLTRLAKELDVSVDWLLTGKSRR